VIYDVRAVFDTDHFRYMGLSGIRYGMSFCYREYMAGTLPGMMSELLKLPVPFTLSQSGRFVSRPAALQATKLKRRQMRATKDEARSLRKGLRDSADEVSSGKAIKLSHHLVMTVYGDSYPELIANAGKARHALAESMAVITPEDLANEAAFFSQLPGNREWRTRPGDIRSRNYAELVGWCGHPTGRKDPHWKAPLARFATTAATYYDYDPFVRDVGHTLIVGSTGLGKTTILGFLLAMFDQYMVDPPHGNIILFGKDRGNELFARAVDGHNVYVRAGQDSGVAPLLGFHEDTPYARSRLRRLVRALILSDGLGPLLPQDDYRIGRGVAGQLRLPLELRSFAGMREFMGWRNQLGAGPRFERWCRGGALGWAFDGQVNHVNFDAGLTLIDLTEVLDIPEVVEPMAQHLRDRIGELLDGRRIVIAFDEARAYLLSPTFEQEIKDFLQTLRKQNGVAFVISQQAEDMLGGKFGPALVGQCHTVMATADPNANKRTYCSTDDGLGFTEGEFEALQNLLPFQWLIKRRQGLDESVIVDFDLSRLPQKFIRILSGRTAKVRFADTMRAQGRESWLDAFEEAAE
jgi:type IV secretion system protein VirB4